jgi:hypothetical protein
MLRYTAEQCQSIMNEANVAAQISAARWILDTISKGEGYEIYQASIIPGQVVSPPLGIMLDLCGRAYIRFKDKRSATYRSFDKHGFVEFKGSGIIDLHFPLHGRQEYGLHMASVRGALDVLRKYEFFAELEIHQYFD